MSWARLDDGFHRNPKQLRMTDAAFRLYVCALSYCAEPREPTGYISAEQADALRRALRKWPRVITELLELNAWEPADGGYLIHDYDEYVERGSRDRVRKHRALKRHGNVTETSLARDGYPVPKPVVFNSPSVGSPLVENSGDRRPLPWREIKAAFEYRRSGEAKGTP